MSADGWGQLYRSIYLFLFGGLVLFVPQTVERLLEEQKKVLQTMRIAEDRANHDPLSGLANRAYLVERVRVALEGTSLRGSQGAVVYFDLDGFKLVNDTFGHQAGDEILREVSRRLQTVTRGSDLAARVGGDEFVVLVPEIEGEQGAEVLARRILGILSEPWTVQAQPVSMGPSVGVVVFPQGGSDPELLLQRADEAMYSVKKTGKGRWTLARSEVLAPKP